MICRVSRGALSLALAERVLGRGELSQMGHAA